MTKHMDEQFAEVKEELKTKVDKSTFLKSQDKVLEKIETISREQKKVLKIHNEALKEKKILSPQQAEEVDKLRVF